ncbi:uncharacterized protein LOC134276859 isoform X2 [Saccostrea cucullata]|uniref:uncharacterized protein LOC134276859 isoform X2 n=1 Tax=Saccostrea cuccullata TaxID=36930 RepID=UPI002ED3AC81
MSDCGDMGDCDCDCGDGCDCDCGDDCCKFDDDCCDCSCFSCGDDGCCGGNDGCCGDDHVHGNHDNISVDGHRHGGGCNCSWCICFLITEDDDCCGSEERRRRRNQRRYELERRRQMEVEGRNLPSEADGVNPANVETSQLSGSENSPPAAITTQPPSYDEVVHSDTIVTSQPVQHDILNNRSMHHETSF